MNDSNSIARQSHPDDSATRVLLAEAKKGDESAVNRLMEQNRQQLRNLVRMRLDKRVQQRIDVSDVVQEILVDAYRRLGTYLENPQLPFGIWLRQIARDRIIDAYRKHRGSSNRSMDRETKQGIGLSGSEIQRQAAVGKFCALTPAAIAMQKEISLQVEAAITQLKETDGQIIIMRHYQALSNREIAEKLKLSEAAASIRYARALRKLKTLLSQQSASHSD